MNFREIEPFRFLNTEMLWNSCRFARIENDIHCINKNKELRMKKCVFTICAKNYLAQALCLKSSCNKHNPDLDFFIYLSDAKDVDNIPEAFELDDSWVPNWKSMAFKYDVIEFSTAIKPFCFNNLFSKGYDKVVYLDPDIYVFSKLDCIWDYLDGYSVVLTPHRCSIMASDYNKIQPDGLVSRVGIYNLGFLGLKNDKVGRNVADWWMEKLRAECYDDAFMGLFVDQKWMDFIPAYFPENTLICHNLGLNVATWNINERRIIYKNDIPFVEDASNPAKAFPLVFFHFSGFSPLKPNLIDKRNENTDVIFYPSVKLLLEEYASCEIMNKYDLYSQLSYSFNCFTDGTQILKLNRRLYRFNSIWESKGDPFDKDGFVYSVFKKNHLLSKKKNSTIKEIKLISNNRGKGHSAGKMKFMLFRFFILLFGVDMFVKLLNFFCFNSRIENGGGIIR